MINCSSEVALVIGGTGGIGVSTVRRLLAEEAAAALRDRSLALPGFRVARMIPVRVGFG